MSGRRSRSKGVRVERSIVNALQATGIGAVRVPLSGAVDGFRELYSWLTNRDVLVVKADRQEPLVVVRLSLAAEIAKVAV
jgi:Holliday junction resolvase